MILSVDNYIYTGTIKHRRFTPFNHFFTYPIFMVYFDISKVETMLRKSWIWNINKPSLVSFYRSDYHGESEYTLDESVRLTIFQKTGKKVTGPIRILTHLRYFGFCFNPVSFYYCFDEDDKNIELIMAEVTNTPWKERFTYLIDKKNKATIDAKMDKEFHVSPFWGMDHQYEWSFSHPQEAIYVKMKNFNKGEKVFDATLKLDRIPLTLMSLLKNTFRYPFITIMVVFRIHWQALKLWIKGAQFFIHPKKIKT